MWRAGQLALEAESWALCALHALPAGFFFGWAAPKKLGFSVRRRLVITSKNLIQAGRLHARENIWSAFFIEVEFYRSDYGLR